MESVEDHTSRDTTGIIKGKRTKRQRVVNISTPPACSSPTSSTSAISGSTTTEEEDMAHCLILLARGGRGTENQPEETAVAAVNACNAADDKLAGAGGSRRFSEAVTTTPGKAGYYVYECKTCNKCFPSFQALGGHRASHKKPKITATNPTAIAKAHKKEFEIDEESLQISLNSFSRPSPPLAAAGGAAKARVHECSICGAEFTSGQALGGHMRRHRPLGLHDTSPSESKKERNVLSLDLNLPAPTDDDRPDEFARPPMIFSASALVDCHY